MTGKHNFDDAPNSPPVILSKTGQPEIGRIVWIDNVQPEWLLRVSVRDEDIAQVLQAQWRVWHLDDMAPMFAQSDITRTGGPLRDLDVRVNTANLVNYRCHRLELLVSGSFIGFTDPERFGLVAPGDETDVASAVWWIWEGQGETTPIARKGEIAESCEAIEDVLHAEMAPITEPMP